MRTDTQLQQEVLAALKRDQTVDTTQVRVAVDGGCVTLAGEVDGYADKWNAERLALGVRGVEAVAVEIKVALPVPCRRSDAEIARGAENVLHWMHYLTRGSVKVAVKDGWITLSGEVEWQFQRQAAGGAVRYLTGVTGMTDHIAIRTEAPPSAARLVVEAQIRRHAAKGVHVAFAGQPERRVGVDKG